MTAPLFGYHMPSFTFRGVSPEKTFEAVAERAAGAEKAGFEFVTVMDHFYQIAGVGQETEPMMEAYATLGALALRTTKVKLFTLVTGVTYRNPAILAKLVTTLDVISNGRAMLGIGAAWNESEHKGYGIPFPPVGERMDRLEEACTIARLMFTKERATFTGKHYKIDNALNSPRPIQPGGPKILIGGTGEKRTLKIAARHADWTHWFASSLDDLKAKNEVLLRHCEAEKRDPATITRTIGAPVTLIATEKEAEEIKKTMTPERIAASTPCTPERAAEIIRPYMDAGFVGYTFRNATMYTPEQFGLATRLKGLLGG